MHDLLYCEMSIITTITIQKQKISSNSSVDRKPVGSDNEKIYNPQKHLLEM